MNFRSIRFRLSALYTLFVVLAFLFFGAWRFFSLRHSLNQQLEETLRRRAEQIGSELLSKPSSPDVQYLFSEIQSGYAPELIDRYLRISDASGSVFYVSGAPKGKSFDPHDLPLPDAEARVEYTRMVKSRDDKVLMIFTRPFFSPEKKLFVEVGAPYAANQAVLDELVSSLAVSLPILAGIASLSSLVLIRRALTPVDRIRESAETISSHCLHERLPVTRTGDEIERLSLALNYMISRLEEAATNDRRFLADASHELRTPLTILRNELEQILEAPGLQAEVRKTAESSVEEVHRLGHIVDRLFALAKSEAPPSEAERKCFDLGKMVASTAEQMCLLAEDKNVSLTTHSPEGVAMVDDAAAIKQVIVNLLDNAIKYTPAGGKVHATVSARADQAILEVTDTGIGIPESAVPAIFDRFFRVSSKSVQSSGAGLGLAIVKSICHSHGGSVHVRSKEGSGSQFTVQLPLSRQKPL